MLPGYLARSLSNYPGPLPASVGVFPTRTYSVIDFSEVARLGIALRSESAPIGKKMRAVFMLRTMGTVEAASELARSLVETRGGSVLLRHELGFVLGQLGFKESLPSLTKILEDVEENEIVRHEAGEAIGAIGDPSSIPILEKFLNDHRPEVRETCAIALERVRWITSGGKVDKEDKENPFYSVDPAPPLENVKQKSTAELGEILCDTSRPLYERYRAMFSLRNRGGEEEVLALTQGFKDPSALFRHEIAYVLGQLAHAASFSGLREVLRNEMEHPMVRHEAAEAIGAIGTEECEELLREYTEKEKLGESRDVEIVRESCEVALDVVEYWAEFDKGGKTTE